MELDPIMAELYPHLARWVEESGWVEIGQDGESSSFVRALNEGGLVWEGQEDYPTLEAALKALDTGIAHWLEEVEGEF